MCLISHFCIITLNLLLCSTAVHLSVRSGDPRAGVRPLCGKHRRDAPYGRHHLEGPARVRLSAQQAHPLLQPSGGQRHRQSLPVRNIIMFLKCLVFCFIIIQILCLCCQCWAFTLVSRKTRRTCVFGNTFLQSVYCTCVATTRLMCTYCTVCCAVGLRTTRWLWPATRWLIISRQSSRWTPWRCSRGTVHLFYIMCLFRHQFVMPIVWWRKCWH